MDNPSLDHWVRFVAEFFYNNNGKLLFLHIGNFTEEARPVLGTSVFARSLKEFELFGRVGVRFPARMRGRPLNFLSLGVKGMRKEVVEKLLQSFSGHAERDGVISPSNSPKYCLRLTGGNEEHVECISHMIKTNKHFHILELPSLPLLPRDWNDHLFPALKDNCTVEELDVQCSEGLTDEVFESLMDLLQNSNTKLKDIDLFETELEARQGQVNEELRINREYRYQWRDEPQSTITFGRIVFCGYGFAGKTEISKTMKQTEEKGWMPRSLKTGFKKLEEKVGREVYKEWAERTRGFEVITLKDQAYVKSIWDFAGQKEYYALHDYVFPNNKNSLFLYVCSCRFPPDHPYRAREVKDKTTIKSECEFWMRFVASNSKPGGPVYGKLPQVSFILTKTDTITFQQRGQMVEEVEDVVADLSGMFKNVLNLDSKVEVVDSRSPKQVKCLLTTCRQKLEQILGGQKEFDVCQELRNLVEEWSKSNPKKPVLSLYEFNRLWIEKEKLREFSEEARKRLLAYLHDLGEIIYHQQSDYIVTNPTWFGIDVLGSMIEAFKGPDMPSSQHPCSCFGIDVLGWLKEVFKGADMPSSPLHHDQGFVKRQAMQKHLERSLKRMDLKQSIPPEKLIDLMVRLELCFQSEPEEDEKGKHKIEKGNAPFFVPALFDDKTEAAANGRRKLEWKLRHESGRIQHLGRRLECKDRTTTFLTPGFFPRLQVHLRNYLHERGWTKNVFEVGRNLIRFAENGIEVCVEYAGDNDDFIDILVRSSAPFAEALKFIEVHVVQTIRTFCASPQGCQGVVLVESIIRPICVEDLHLCIQRKAHSVLVSSLEDKLRENEAYRHIWSESLDGESDVVLARDLVRGKGLSLETLSSNDGFPRHFFPSVEDVGSLEKFGTRLNLTKIIPIKLHIQCQHGEKCHPVTGQPGRRINLKDTAEGYDFNVTKLAITLLWAGAGATATAFGAPVALPSIDDWVRNLFKADGLPGLDAERVQKLVSTCKSAGPVSEKQILKALKKYWEVDPCSQGLKEFLKLQDGKKFWEDFKLRKVIYTEGEDRGTVGWLCDEHFEEGIQQGILRSAFH